MWLLLLPGQNHLVPNAPGSVVLTVVLAGVLDGEDRAEPGHEL